jgi:diguanylate cyclase (GGDEF)-like protein
MDRFIGPSRFGAIIMTTQEAIVAVLVAAIFTNVVLAIGLIVGPRVRARREASYRAGVREAAGVGPGLPSAGVTRPLANSRPHPVGPGAPYPGALDARHVGSPRAFAVDPPVATTDPETGFELAGAWAKWLAEEGARVDRYGHPATIVLVELNGVDRLAERLGPEAADRLIPPISTTMRRHARASDNLARLGRARFGVLLTETDEILAINYVERVRSACDVWLESGAVALRLSIGWAEVGPKQPVEVAIQAAETRLNEERQRLRTRPDLDANGDASPGAEAEKGPDVQTSTMHPVRA